MMSPLVTFANREDFPPAISAGGIVHWPFELCPPGVAGDLPIWCFPTGPSKVETALDPACIDEQRAIFADECLWAALTAHLQPPREVDHVEEAAWQAKWDEEIRRQYKHERKKMFLEHYNVHVCIVDFPSQPKSRSHLYKVFCELIYECFLVYQQRGHDLQAWYNCTKDVGQELEMDEEDLVFAFKRGKLINLANLMLDVDVELGERLRRLTLEVAPHAS